MQVNRFSVFEYLYRDAGNFKAWGALLLKGTLTEAQVSEIRTKLEGGEFFIAEQIGGPPLYQERWAYSDGPTESDHVWHEFFTLRPAEENGLGRWCALGHGKRPVHSRLRGCSMERTLVATLGKCTLVGPYTLHEKPSTNTSNLIVIPKRISIFGVG